jgi:hypothetical protein
MNTGMNFEFVFRRCIYVLCLLDLMLYEIQADT